MTIEYESRLVLFLDVLGWRHIVEQSVASGGVRRQLVLMSKRLDRSAIEAGE